jgi:hypothetical protein
MMVGNLFFMLKHLIFFKKKTKLKLKHIIHSQAYGAMVSRTHLAEKTLDSNGLMDHPTGLYHGKNADGNI